MGGFKKKSPEQSGTSNSKPNSKTNSKSKPSHNTSLSFGGQGRTSGYGTLDVSLDTTVNEIDFIGLEGTSKQSKNVSHNKSESNQWDEESDIEFNYNSTDEDSNNEGELHGSNLFRQNLNMRKDNDNAFHFDSPFQPVGDLYDDSGDSINFTKLFPSPSKSKFAIVNIWYRLVNYIKYGSFSLEDDTPLNDRSQDSNDSVTFDQDMKTTKLQGYLGKFLFSIFYLLKTIQGTLRIYFTSLLSLVFSVIIIAVLYQTIQKSNIIFLYVAEGNAGEMDFIWQRKLTNASTEVFLNQTRVEEEIFSKSLLIDGEEVRLDKYITNVTSRWLLPGHIANVNDPSKNTSIIFLVSDTEREKEIGIGRYWDHRPLGIQEAHVRDVLLKAVDARPNYGDEVYLSLDLHGLLGILNGDSLSSESTDPDNPAAPRPSPKTDEDILRGLLERAGFDFSQVIHINITRIAEERHIDIPEPLKPIVDQFGIIDITGEQIFQFLSNNTDSNFAGANFRVVDSIEGSDGLFPSSLGNIVIVDSKHITEVIRRTLAASPTVQFLLIASNLTDTVDNFLSSFRIGDISLMLVGMLKNRFSIYEKSSANREREIIKISDGIMSILGIDYPISVTFPLISVMALSDFLALFMNQIFNTVLVILGILACILLNMLLMSNIDDHVYEYGMVRALGLDKTSLVGVIFAYAFMFAIPGVIIGLVLAFGVNLIVEVILSAIIKLPYIDWKMDPLALIIPTVVGLAVPTLANVLPARKALSRTLRDALDLTFQTFNQTTVTMIRLEKMGIKPWQTVVSVLLVVAGFVVYYMIPYSFIFQDFNLFFIILNGILLAMKIGLCIIAVVFQPIMEKAILFFILIGPERRLRKFIEKNMAGHRNRSRQTFLMFTIATAFVIFAGVSFSLQTSAIIQNAESLIGSDLVVMANSHTHPLPEEDLSGILDGFKQQGIVDDYSYVSFPMRRSPIVFNERFSALAGYPLGRVQMYSVSENYLQTAMSTYFIASDVDSKFDYEKLSDGKPDIIRSLYVDAGKAHVSGEIDNFFPKLVTSGRPLHYIGKPIHYNTTKAYADYVDAIPSTATKESHSVGINIPARLSLSLTRNSNVIVSHLPWLLKPKAFVSKFPGFVFSSYSISSTNSPLIVSEKDYKKCLKAAIERLNFTPEESENLLVFPKNRVLIRLRKGVSIDDKSMLLNSLRSALNSEQTLVQSVEDIVSSTATAETILTWAFNALSLVACILCFLNLITAFTANVKDNQWIYGVLRALGMTGFQLTRSYIYEAICLVLAAFICGSLIGTALAITLVIQQNLFLENPLVFNFPWILFFSLLAMAVVVAIAGSWIPSRNLQKKEIAFILKGL